MPSAALSSRACHASSFARAPICTHGRARADGRDLALGYCVNATALYDASRENALVTPPKGSSEGRVCLDEYKQLGYIPQGCSDADVSRSMNYWHSDWALSQAATLLGTTTKDPDGYSYADDAAVLGKRAKNWVKLLDHKTP